MAQVIHGLDNRRTRLHADPARSYTLPGWAYTDPALFLREREEIFYRTWHYAGALQELEQPGDYVTADLLDQSVIVIRGKDGVLRAFHNVCQHRAHQLLRGCGRAKVITCPYHAWSFHADGRLRTARGAETLPNFDAKEFALKPVRVEVFAKHFVFFNLDPDAQPLSELAGDLEAELESEIPHFHELRPTGPASGYGSMKANWKVAVDNYLECYHCRPAHPAFADLIDMESYRLAAQGLWSSQKGKLGRLDNKAYPVKADQPGVARFWWLWPTTSFNVMPGEAALSVFNFAPLAVDSTLQWGQRFTVTGKDLDKARLDYGAEVLGPEDVGICEAVQRGLNSKGYDAGRFIHDPAGGETTEAAVHHFHRLVVETLGI